MLRYTYDQIFYCYVIGVKVLLCLSAFREPVSRFKDDSIYGVSVPQVDRVSHEMFESHVMVGQGQVRVLCREDMLMYREYVKNRYM